MNSTESPPPVSRLPDLPQTRFALRIAARLEELSRDVPADIDQRLRFAREQALERARAARRAVQPARAHHVRGAVLALGGGGTSWWVRLAAVLPLVVLIGGLTLIQERQWRAQIEAAAQIDAAILTDDLPPVAYSDPGFAEYLKAAPE
jgi:hypothetical protein